LNCKSRYQSQSLNSILQQQPKKNDPFAKEDLDQDGAVPPCSARARYQLTELVFMLAQELVELVVLVVMLEQELVELVVLVVMLEQELEELVVLVVMVRLQSRQGGIVIEYAELELELDEDVVQGCVSVVVFHIVESTVEIAFRINLGLVR
jgi:hypothetical protein